MNTRKMNARKLLVSVLMLGCVLVTACTSATATPLAPTAVPPTSIPPTTAPTATPDQSGNTFSPTTFDLPITFSYSSDWKIDSEVSSQVSFTYKDYDGYFSFINPKTAKVASPAAPYSVIPFPDDFVNWIQAHGLIQVVKTQSVIVGGLPGTQIDADATPACGEKTMWFLVGTGGWNCSFVDGHYRFIYLDDVHGERLLIMTQGNIPAQDFVLMTDASQKILDSVIFSKP